MIIDYLDNYKQYLSLSKNIALALEHLRSVDFTQKEAGRYDIAGDNIYVLVNDYQTKTISEGSLEAHRKYIDVQFMVNGCEMMGYAVLNKQIPHQDYNEAKDVLLFKDSFSLISFNRGMFAIFFPQDLHMPGVGEPPSLVRKVVVKIKI